MAPKICLIVDNPLRDLDGLVLLAWQLARRGAKVWLVPMYEQGFDVFAMRPDWVVSNYVRPNNLDLLRLYRRAGIHLCVLDTEGAGGKTAQEFAGMVGQSGGAHLCNLYCVWGESQWVALAQDGRVPGAALRLTGCPRYDFCVEPWRNALPATALDPGFILVNTNFPVVNPRFSSGAEGEKRSMLQAGFTAEFADAYIRDARVALDGVIAALEKLLVRFPNQRFVLRPHPFEHLDAYRPLQTRPNFHLRQEGTSIQWLNQCAFLLHLNCSTAVEAVMLGREAISMAWLDTPALKVPAPSQVSRHAASVEELIGMMHAMLAGDMPALDARLAAERGRIVSEVYHAIDGRSAARIADALVDFTPAARPGSPEVAASWRGRAVHWTRQLLGYSAAAWIRRRISDRKLEQRRSAKRFTLSEVNATLGRIARAVPDGRAIEATPARGPDRNSSRLASGAAICISAAKNTTAMHEKPRGD